jgi:hypothetical protein
MDQVTGYGSFEYALGSDGLPLRGWGWIVFPELDKGFPYAAGGGGCDALVDGECLPQAGGAFAGVAITEMAVADAFQRPGVVVAGLDPATHVRAGTGLDTAWTTSLASASLLRDHPHGRRAVSRAESAIRCAPMVARLAVVAVACDQE